MLPAGLTEVAQNMSPAGLTEVAQNMPPAAPSAALLQSVAGTIAFPEHFAMKLPSAVSRCRPAPVLTVLLALCLAGLPIAAPAEILRDLYLGETVVENRLVTERASGSGRALLQVLLRLTGRGWLPESPAIQDALRDGSPYMRSYRYRRVELADEDELTLLSVQFEPRLVEQLLREAGFVLWPANRPNVVTWLVQRGEEAQFLSPDLNPDVGALVENYTRRHGLPVRMPLMDLEDQARLSAEDVLRSKRRELWKASERYVADSVLGGFLSGAPGQAWVARWTYLYGKEAWSFAVSCADAPDCVRSALDAVRDFLVARQALPPERSAPGSLRVEVGGVDHFSVYAGLLAYLRGLEQVQTAQPVYLEDERILFALDSRATPELLREVFALDRRIEQQDGVQTAEQQAAADLHYSIPGAR